MNDQEISLARATQGMTVNNDSESEEPPASVPAGMGATSVPRKSIVGRVHEKMGTFR